MTIRPQPTEFSSAERSFTPQDRCASILEALLTSRGNPSDEIEQVLAENPELAFGHCLRIAIIVRRDDGDARSRCLESVTAIESICRDADHPARRHAFAARAWLDGDQVLAAERYGAIVADCPRDILALVVAHAFDFRLGLRQMLRDRIARVLPHWHAAIPFYASVLAMYAFGLEENGQYGRAERMARRALELDPRHAGAVHAISHVMEMQGRCREGLAFLTATEAAWVDTGFAVHLAWHRALFHLEAGDAQSALAVYDARIAQSCSMSELADASALLWRLQFCDTRLGARWSQLADRWDGQVLAGARSFYITHAMMAFAAAGRTVAVQRIFDLLREADSGAPSALYSEEALVLPLCTALFAFSRRDYATCIERLVRVRDIAHRCGGSLAQCDLIQLTVVEAALRARKVNLARVLVAERMAQKPSSRLNRRFEQRLA